jgi:hypothetical protein
MSDLNVISRTQHIDVNPASSSVSIISTGQAGPTGATGPPHPSGVPEVSGLSVRGTTDMSIPTAGTGSVIYLDPVSGILENRGADLQLVNTGATTHLIKILTAGLYHINGHVRTSPSTPYPGSLIGIRVNGQALARHMFSQTSYASVFLSREAYLNVNDQVCLFGYTPGTPFVVSAVNRSSIDPYSPQIDIWRIAAGPKGDPG